MPTKLSIPGSGRHSGVSHSPGAGLKVFLEKWDSQLRELPTYSLKAPKLQSQWGLRAPKRTWALSAYVELPPPCTDLHRLAWPAPATEAALSPASPAPYAFICPEASKVHLLGSSDQKWRTESSSSLCLLPRWQKHEVTPGHSPQALTSNTHLVYCWNTETQDQSQWGKCSMPQFTDP